MSQYIVRVCDICKAEQRQDTDVYWACRFDGPVTLDFKPHGAIQQVRRFDTLCRGCAKYLSDGLWKLIEERKTLLEKKERSNDQQ